eukprot:1448122-Amphidinium_carterae.2
MQDSGRLVNDKRAFGYRPSLRQIGRIRAFIDNEVDFRKFAAVIWGDTDDEQDFPLVPEGSTLASGVPKTRPAPVAEPKTLEATPTTEELFNSKKPQATAAKALLSQAKCKMELEELLKAESSDEGFQDDRDAADQSGVPTELGAEQTGEPTVDEEDEPIFEDAEDFQPSLEEELRARDMQAELHARASQAVASASASGGREDDVDFDQESDL